MRRSASHWSFSARKAAALRQGIGESETADGGAWMIRRPPIKTFRGSTTVLHNRSSKLFVFSVFLITQFLQISYAQNLRGEFTERDIPAIIEAFKKHELKFQHFYKGRTFNGEFALNEIRPAETFVSPYKKGFLIELRRGGPLPSLHFQGSVNCIVTDQTAYREIASWNPGNSWTGQRIVSRGVITSASDTHLILSDQVIRAVGGTPDNKARLSDIRCNEDKDDLWTVGPR